MKLVVKNVNFSRYGLLRGILVYKGEWTSASGNRRMMNMPSIHSPGGQLPPPSGEEVGPGVYCEWSNNYQIALFTVRGGEEATINAWVENTLLTVKAWPADKPLLMLLDVSYRNNLPVTRYAREKAISLITRCKAIRREGPGGGLALIFARATVNQTLHHLFESGDYVLSIPLRIFYDRDLGLLWLSRLLDKHLDRINGYLLS